MRPDFSDIRNWDSKSSQASILSRESASLTLLNGCLHLRTSDRWAGRPQIQRTRPAHGQRLATRQTSFEVQTDTNGADECKKHYGPYRRWCSGAITAVSYRIFNSAQASKYPASRFVDATIKMPI